MQQGRVRQCQLALPSPISAGGLAVGAPLKPFSAQWCFGLFNWDQECKPISQNSMVDWWELMQAQPSFLFNGEDLTHNNQQSFKKPLTSTPLSNIHQKVFCHKVLTYKGAMLQYWFCFVWSWVVPLGMVSSFLLHYHWAMMPNLPFKGHQLQHNDVPRVQLQL